MTREIILDTETTGLFPKSGDRIIEIACLEIYNRKPTGKYFHAYVNPDRDVPLEATRIHGITTEFLKPYPSFDKIADEVLNFCQTSPLVIHNAPFDLKFLHAEYGLLEREVFRENKIIDTLDMARALYPRQPNNLDALCKRFNIDLSKREKHGALLDCELLAKVYFELTGGGQKILNLESVTKEDQKIQLKNKDNIRPKRFFPASQEEILAHNVLLDDLKDPLWRKVS